MKLREQFESEQRAKTQDNLELMFLLSDQYYIPWLENKIEKL